MKKILYVFALVSSFILASCNSETESLFGESASNRIEETLDNAQQVLVSAPNGWLMKYYPSSQQSFGGYNVLMSFTAEGEVTVSADIASPDAKSTSLYRLKEQAGPTLTVDTYNEIFHYFSDPASGVGDLGLGMEGDYEFTIQSATPEQVVLRGKKTGNTIVMTPMPENETWESYLTDIQNAEAKANAVVYTYTVNGEEFSAQKSYRTFAITHTVNEESVTETFAYIQTKDGMEFYSPITIGGMEVSKLIFDSASNSWKSEDGKAVMTPEATPAALLFANGGPWFVTYDGMSEYGQEYATAGLLRMSQNIEGDYTLDYLVLGSYYYTNYAVNIGYGPYEGIMLLTTTVLSDTEVNLALPGNCDQTGLDLWNAGFQYVVYPIAYLNGGVTFTVEPDDPYSPTTIKLTQVDNPSNVIVVTNQETKFGYHE